MNVRELKEKLKDYDDDTEVFLATNIIEGREGLGYEMRRLIHGYSTPNKKPKNLLLTSLETELNYAYDITINTEAK